MKWQRISGLMPLDSSFCDSAPAGGGGKSDADLEAQINRLLDSKGDRAAVGTLLRDNLSQRDEIRDLKAKLEAAPKVPEGGRILKADEVKAYEAYVALGKPEDIQKSLASKVELEGKVKAAELAEGRRAAAALYGWKDSVLAKLPGADTLKYELREETVDGEKVKVAYVTEPTQGAIPKKLTDHADATWKDFLPALTADDEGSEDGTPASRKTTGGEVGPEFVRQKPKGSAGGKKTDDEYRQATEKTVDYTL